MTESENVIKQIRNSCNAIEDLINIYKMLDANMYGDDNVLVNFYGKDDYMQSAHLSNRAIRCMVDAALREQATIIDKGAITLIKMYAWPN